MPPARFALLIAAVIALAGVTIWLLTSAGPPAVYAVPVLLIAALAVRLWVARK